MESWNIACSRGATERKVIAPRRRNIAKRMAATVVAAVLLTGAAAGLAGLLAAASGANPADALQALWRGSVGSRYAFLSGSLLRATPLILCGLAVAVAFTAGVMNIGAEGQLLAGAALTTAIGVALGPSLGSLALPLALFAGALGGAAWAFIPAWLRRRFGVLEVITTIMMNFVALNVVGYLVRGPLQEPTRVYPQSASLPEAARLPLLPGGTRLHAGFLIAVACAAVAWWVLRSTAAGFRARVIGASPEAAHSAALIDVGGGTLRVFLVSGALAGLAGAIEVTGVTYSLYENLSPGYGYTAIVVALVGALNPLLTACSGAFFGALEAGAAAMQRDAGVPSVIATVVEASIILVVLAMASLRARVARRVRAAADDTSPEERTRFRDTA